MKNTLLFILSIFTLSCMAQAPVLVSDFNTGEADAFESTTLGQVELNGTLFFPLSHQDTGEELGILKDGELSILKDINVGPEGSEIQELTVYNDLVYFTADDGENGWAIWQTDGTAAGTVLAHAELPNSPYRPRGYIVSASGKMYYTFNNQLYVFDGANHTSIFDGAIFFTDFSSQGKNYVAYKDEIAFLRETSNSEVELYAVEDGQAVFLAKIENVSGFPDFFGLTALSDGLLFGLQDSFEPAVEGTYFYNETTATLNRFMIDGEAKKAIRIVKYSDSQVLALVLGLGYALLDGSNDMEVTLYESSSVSSTQGQKLNAAFYNGKMLFDANDGFFGDEYLIYSEGTIGSTINVFELTYASDILLDGNFAYIADKTSNGFDPVLFKIDMMNGSFEFQHFFTEPSNNTNSVQPIAVQGNKLFLLINLDDTVGRELYSITLGPIDATDEYENPEFTIEMTASTFLIEHEENLLADVRIYDTAGRLLEIINTRTKTVVDISHLSGMHLLEFIVDEKRLTKKFYR